MQRTNKSPGGEPGLSRVVMQRDRRVASDSGALMAAGPAMTLANMYEQGVHYFIRTACELDHIRLGCHERILVK